MSKDLIPYPHMRDIREDFDLSQADIAKLLHCTQASYSYYEIGKRDIPTQSLIKLAKYYNTSADYLLGLTNDRTPYKQ